MKFKTTDIINRIDNLLKDLEGKAITRAEEHDEKLQGSRDAWFEDHADSFRSFARTIIRCLAAGEPVTLEDIPAPIKGRGADLKFYYTPANSRPLAEERRAENLTKLRNALKASTEDTVSPTAIKQLGFQDVTFLFSTETAD